MIKTLGGAALMGLAFVIFLPLLGWLAIFYFAGVKIHRMYHART